MLQQKMKEILQKEDDLQEIVQSLASTIICNLPSAFISSSFLSMSNCCGRQEAACTCGQFGLRLVGKDSLSEDQKCTLEVAKIIREAHCVWLHLTSRVCVQTQDSMSLASSMKMNKHPNHNLTQNHLHYQPVHHHQQQLQQHEQKHQQHHKQQHHHHQQ